MKYGMRCDYYRTSTSGTGLPIRSRLIELFGRGINSVFRWLRKTPSNIRYSYRTRVCKSCYLHRGGGGRVANINFKIRHPILDTVAVIDNERNSSYVRVYNEKLLLVWTYWCWVGGGYMVRDCQPAILPAEKTLKLWSWKALISERTPGTPCLRCEYLGKSSTNSRTDAADGDKVQEIVFAQCH